VLQFPAGAGNFSVVQTDSETHTMGTGDLCLGVSMKENEAYHSPPSITEVKNAWRYIPHCPHGFMEYRGLALSFTYRRNNR